MNTIKYLNEHGLGALIENLGIKVSVHEPTLLHVLNYDQIKSPKTDPVVQECRSLVVAFEDNRWQVVSRSFDRFFNYGEIEGDEHNINEYTAYEKLDGSLLGVFNYKGSWYYRTRSMIMPEGLVNGFGSTWKEFIEDALGWTELTERLHRTHTYIFEVVGADNRVVVRYPERDSYLLAVRDNTTGDYVDPVENFKRPKRFTFDTIHHCLEAAKELPDLEEGYVLYDTQGVPQVKVKNPAYVAAHHLRGEGLTHKRVIELVRINEQDEYLSIFPEDRPQIQPYIEAEQTMREMAAKTYSQVRDIANQKEFAKAVSKLPEKALYFTMRNREQSLQETLDEMTAPAYKRLIEMFLLNGLEDSN